MRNIYQFKKQFQGLIMLALMLSPMLGFSQAQVVEVCELDNFQGNNTHGIYLGNLPGGLAPQFLFDSLGGTLTIYSDSTAQITGRVIHVNQSNFQWDVNIWLINQMDYNTWTGLGRGVKIEQAPPTVVNANQQDWTFYELDDTRSKLTGVTGASNDGDTLYLTHLPANLQYGFQVGIGSNSKNGNDGISGWFAYSGPYNGHGDVNADKNCSTPNCDVSIDSVVAICQPGDSTFTVELQISGSGTYDISDDQGSAVQQGGAGVYTFGPYPDSVGVSFLATDINIAQCMDETSTITANCAPDPCTLSNLDSLILTPVCVNNDSFEVNVFIVGDTAAYVVEDDQGSPTQCCQFFEFTMGPYPNDTVVTITAYNSDEPACRVEASISANCFQDSCAVGIDTVYTQCISDSTFGLMVSFSGFGSNFTIFDDQGSAPSMGLMPGTYSFGEYLNSTDVRIYVADSNFVDSTGMLTCIDMQGPFSADCTPVCDISIDSAYTRCSSDTTFEVVVIVSGEPGSTNGFWLYNSVGDTVPNVGPDTVAFGWHPNGAYIDIYLEDPHFGPNCVVFLDSLTYMPDSAGQVCDTTGSNIAGRIRNFQTSMLSNSVQLKWQTMNRAVPTWFEVERRIGNRPFAVIGKRWMTDMDANEQFSFRDYDLEENVEYRYRIKQVREDGVKTYSPILRTMLKGESEVIFSEVYPNPSRGTATVKLNAVNKHRMTCDLMDVRGAVVSGVEINTVEGVQEISLPVAGLKPGIYLVRFRLENGQNYVRKLMVRE